MSGLCARERKHDRFRYSVCRVSGTKSVQTLSIVATNRNRIPIHREESLFLPISRCEWRQLAEKEEEEAEKRRQNTYQRQSHVPLQVHCAQFTSYVKHLPHDSLVIGTATNRTTKRNDRKNLLMHVRVEGVLFFFPILWLDLSQPLNRPFCLASIVWLKLFNLLCHFFFHLF